MEKIPDIIHESWHKHLQPLFDDPKMELIKSKLLPNCKFYPDVQNIFRVFSMPLNEIRVVILGQDPYFNGSAIGLAFAVKVTAQLPASLRIIKKEIEKEGLISEEHSNISTWKDLSHWVEQGVFLLNTALTVEIGKAGSHTGQWMWFTREVIKIISQNSSCVWMLWGAKAQGFKDYIADHLVMDEDMIDVVTPTHGVLLAPHPAAETYNGGTGKLFTGCNHFTLCNQILENKKEQIINW